MTTTSDCANYSAQCWLLYRGVVLSLLSQLTSLSLVMVFVCSHTSPCIQMVLTGELVSPGQSFHQWTHLGEETSAHLGLFAAHRDCIINSWSEIMAEVLSRIQLLHAKPQWRFLMRIARFCCQRVSNRFLLWWITAAKAHFHAKAEWHLQALFSLTTNSCWFHFLYSRRSSAGKMEGQILVETRGPCHACCGGVSGVGK